MFLAIVLTLVAGGIVLLVASAPSPAMAVELLAFFFRLMWRISLGLVFMKLCDWTGGWRLTEGDGIYDKPFDEMPIYRPTVIGRWLGLLECDIDDAIADDPLGQLYFPHLAEDTRELSCRRRRWLMGATRKEMNEGKIDAVFDGEKEGPRS